MDDYWEFRKLFIISVNHFFLHNFYQNHLTFLRFWPDKPSSCEFSLLTSGSDSPSAHPPRLQLVLFIQINPLLVLLNLFHSEVSFSKMLPS